MLAYLKQPRRTATDLCGLLRASQTPLGVL